MSDDDKGDAAVREQDRFLPIANISRIMKKALPSNAKIAKDAKETVQECVSEFISFITSEASDKCQREKRKTINGDDLLWAMSTLGFEEYVEPLKMYLQKFREAEATLAKQNGQPVDIKKMDGTTAVLPPQPQAPKPAQPQPQQMMQGYAQMAGLNPAMAMMLQQQLQGLPPGMLPPGMMMPPK